MRYAYVMNGIFLIFAKKKDKTTRFFNIVSIFYGIIKNKIACLNAIDRT